MLLFSVNFDFFSSKWLGDTVHLKTTTERQQLELPLFLFNESQELPTTNVCWRWAGSFWDAGHVSVFSQRPLVSPFSPAIQPLPAHVVLPTREF